eukprot:CAMPEP_0119048136 /NCGR_PEP_ID=MMETSP1177-20130426/57210_1 /TAXON_ID=2985 /ORGANISM="Ochromonas sp, Strain CCMP1899" /LENGTH=722 /DNA_ID=CAMNT_0007023637 /DNA_START=136 /DNA_END=2304 /DNA_ORIENTATION=-
MELELDSSPSSKPEVMAKAVEAISGIMKGLEKKKQHSWKSVIDPLLLGLLIGKQGVKINKLRTDSGASIDIDKATDMIEVKGSETCVALAVTEIQTFLLENATEKSEKTSSTQLTIPTKAFPFIIGPKGTKAQELTQLSGARFDLDRDKQLLTMRGPPEKCQKLKDMILDILKGEGLLHDHEMNDKEENLGVTGGVLGPVPGQGEELDDKKPLNMSKSAVRRRRRRREIDQQELNELLMQKQSNEIKSVQKVVRVTADVEVIGTPMDTPRSNKSWADDSGDDDDNDKVNKSNDLMGTFDRNKAFADKLINHFAKIEGDAAYGNYSDEDENKSDGYNGSDGNSDDGSESSDNSNVGDDDEEKTELEYSIDYDNYDSKAEEEEGDEYGEFALGQLEVENDDVLSRTRAVSVPAKGFDLGGVPNTSSFDNILRDASLQRSISDASIGNASPISSVKLGSGDSAASLDPPYIERDGVFEIFRNKNDSSHIGVIGPIHSASKDNSPTCKNLASLARPTSPLFERYHTPLSGSPPFEGEDSQQMIHSSMNQSDDFYDTEMQFIPPPGLCLQAKSDSSSTIDANSDKGSPYTLGDNSPSMYSDKGSPVLQNVATTSECSMTLLDMLLGKGMEPERSLTRDSTSLSFPPNMDQETSFKHHHEQQQYEQELHEKFIKEQYLKDQEMTSRRPSQQELNNLLTNITSPSNQSLTPVEDKSGYYKSKRGFSVRL